MNKLPHGPLPQQVGHDRVIGSIMTLRTMLARRKRVQAQQPARWETNGSRWTKVEIAAAEHQCRCEIEALETAVALMEASLSVPRLTLDALNTLARENVDD